MTSVLNLVAGFGHMTIKNLQLSTKMIHCTINSLYVSFSTVSWNGWLSQTSFVLVRGIWVARGFWYEFGAFMTKGYKGQGHQCCGFLASWKKYITQTMSLFTIYIEGQLDVIFNSSKIKIKITTTWQNLLNIIQIHNNVLWDWQYFMGHSHIFPTFRLNVGNIRKYYVEYRQSHITLLWIWIMLCMWFNGRSMKFQILFMALRSSRNQ